MNETQLNNVCQSDWSDNEFEPTWMYALACPRMSCIHFLQHLEPLCQEKTQSCFRWKISIYCRLGPERGDKHMYSGRIICCSPLYYLSEPRRQQTPFYPERCDLKRYPPRCCRYKFVSLFIAPSLLCHRHYLKCLQLQLPLPLLSRPPPLLGSCCSCSRHGS